MVADHPVTLAEDAHRWLLDRNLTLHVYRSRGIVWARLERRLAAVPGVLMSSPVVAECHGSTADEAVSRVINLFDREVKS